MFTHNLSHPFLFPHNPTQRSRHTFYGSLSLLLSHPPESAGFCNGRSCRGHVKMLIPLHLSSVPYKYHHRSIFYLGDPLRTLWSIPLNAPLYIPFCKHKFLLSCQRFEHRQWAHNCRALLPQYTHRLLYTTRCCHPPHPPVALNFF